MSSSLTAAPSDAQSSDARLNTIPSLDGAPPLVTVRHLSKTYRGRPALRDLSLSLPAGRIVGLMGANGCGKTTLLKILAGVLADYEGQVRVAGHAPGPQSKALVSFLPDADFLAGAEAAGLTNLKGHRSVGGMRASIYNAMPIEGVRALIDYMTDFAARA